MRPRQNLRDYHHNSHPSYQSINHNPSLLQPRQQSMMPPHPPSGTPPLLGPAPSSVATRVIQPPLPTTDLISELIKLGLNPDDMANPSNRPADLLRNLQAILGKREAADLLQKLPLNEFLQSEFGRGATVPIGGGSRDSVICGPGAVHPTGQSSFINNINNGNVNKQEQDMHYPNHPNHHQKFRIPATNSNTVHNSPQQQQQQSQQHKQSVLSIHQQQQHQDPANRRMNEQQHMMNTASGSTYGNLNDMSSRTIPTASSLESHNSNIFNRRKPSPPVSSYTIPSASSAPRALNPMDTLGTSTGSGHPSQLDNNMYDNPAFQQHNVSSTNQQQSLIRHQQLQKLLRSASSGPPRSNMPLPASNLSTRNDPHGTNQRTSISNLAHMQRQMTSPNTTSALSPPQQPLSSVPKSLLNLAACTSKSPPVTNSVASTSKSHRTSQPNYSTSVASNNTNPMPNNRVAAPRQSSNSNTAFNSRIANTMDSTNLLHQMISRSNQSKSSNQGPSRNNQSKNALTSLLSDDQKTMRTSTGQIDSQIPSTVTKSSDQTPQKRQLQSVNDNNAFQGDLKSKEAYLAYLQERAAKAGVSIGEISQSLSSQDNLAQARDHSPEVSRCPVRETSAPNSNTKDDEARNDLSLLYPPIELATSSQRQVSLLAAGFDLSEGVDVITDEVRKIIQQECNIIYECKGCSNLFRSLANLVKHKRQFCDNSNIERAYSELNKQFITNAASSEMANSSKTSTLTEQSKNRSTLIGKNRDSSILDSRQAEHMNASVSIGSQKYNLRGRRIDPTPDISSQAKAARMTRSHDRKEQMSGLDAQMILDRNIPPHQTNLSRLLQSQPKSMQPLGKDSALMDALNMQNPTNNRRSVVSNPRNCSVNEINEQLVKNSSLAKTLLNENAKSMSSGSAAMQLARAVAQQPKVDPKRKLLEDCIKKVKRDKMADGVEDEPLELRVAQCSQQRGKKFEHMDQFKDPLAIDDSETDSDALVMDLDESSNTSRSKRKGSRGSRSEDDRMYESSQLNRMNTSSALLKALTRPVESKPSCSANMKSEGDIASAELDRVRQSSRRNSLSTEAKSTGTQQDSLNQSSVPGTSGSSTTTIDVGSEVIPPSPLFDKYTCEMCETDLENQSSLLAHIMESHKKENKIYPCLFCSLTFITLENVCRHIIDIHRKTKAQVGHLKEVVRSRSFISQDFKTCSDCPSTFDQTADMKSDHEEAPVNDLTEKISPDMIETRRSSSVLSDSAATKQILEDTLALVSDSASPEAVNRYNASDRLAQIISRTRPSSTPMESFPAEASKTGERSATIVDDNEDPLCDSLMNNLTEHLAILESQEAEIEAEKQRRQQGVARQEDGEDVGYNLSNGSARTVEHGSPSNVEQASLGEEVTEENVECRNQQTTPSRGKHIVAGQPFHTEDAHTEPDDDGDVGDDDDDLDFTEQESRDVMLEDNSAYDEDIDEPEEVGSDGSDYNQDYEESEESESLSPDNNEPASNDREYCHGETSEQHQKGLGVRINSRVSSRRVHKKRRSSRNDEDDDDEHGDHDETQPHERRHKSDTDLSPSLASDKSETQNLHDVALAKDGGSHSLDATLKNSTMEGGCKLKLKSSVLRDVCGAASGTTSGGQQGSSSADSSGGGIKKLKIQLKAQPDEKSKVYRIVN